jgi:hypothetical protein
MSHPAASKPMRRKVTIMDYRDHAVVVTGGTGALGTAVVTALLAAGAVCHVPYMDEHRIQHFPYRGHERVKLVASRDLADEQGVAQLFDGIDELWASIHIAGGFAMSPLADTDKAGLMAMIDTNLVSCYLCCRAAVRAMARRGAGGRIVNVAARQALEPRAGAGMTAYTVSVIADMPADWPSWSRPATRQSRLKCARRWRRSWCNCGTSTKRLLGLSARSQSSRRRMKRRAG